MKRSIFLGAIFLTLGSGRLYGQVDCNSNNQDDAAEIAAGTAQDCNANGVPDSCDLGGSIDFAVGQSIPVGGSPRSLIGPDLDGNGTVDLVAVNLDDGTVSILRNDGSGVFQVTTLNAGTNPASVAAADLDGDTDLDLAVANFGSDDVSVFFNTGLDVNGNPAFGPATNIAVGTGPAVIVALDLEGDGDTDLAVANRLSDNVTKLLNDGNGVFSSGGNQAVGLEPVAVATADFDGDNISDLAVANMSSNNLTVLLSGGAAPPPTPASFDQPFSLTAGDFDGDGDNDLIAANFGASTVLVLLNDGTGSLTSGQEITRAVNPTFVASGSFDLDGDIDLVVVDADEVLAFDNTGNGTFLLNQAGPVGAGINSLVVAQLNNFGALDVAGADENNDVVVTLQDQTQGATSADCNLNGVPDDCEVDTDGDGIIDACDTDSPPPDDNPPPPAAPQCGTGACGAGAATMAPLMLMGLGWMRPVSRQARRRRLNLR